MRFVYQGKYRSNKLHQGFCRITGRNDIRVKIIIFTGRFILLGINSRYSVLLRLADNFFDVILENTSLIKDSIAERAIEVSSGENDK